ncbi:hypothetical protein BJ875DRAFT_380791 [Amylocarpus encephaloides]|uniref:Uncharacterized protein n=1 Tax=Amylocarpus encephaloides TaxID=45428 RepID=A0A9P7YFQ3_9HELO|nr:hypothetical protein BJ875DRAFT_380791 [Amylocarpus encephaloides]
MAEARGVETNIQPCHHFSSSADLTKLQKFAEKPRIVVLTDVLNEPDDSMSLVRYLLYSNEFDTRGIVATTSKHLRNVTHPDEIRKIVNAYGSVIGNLNNHVHPLQPYQSAEELLSLISTGPPIYGKQSFNLSLSDGSKLIIDRLAESEKPLWVLAWGGTNTLAQALLHIYENRTAEDAATLRSRLRVYSISDQDDTGDWIRREFPDVFVVTSLHAMGAYSISTWAGILSDVSLAMNYSIVQQPWLTANIQLGPLGAVYPNIIYGMEGDSPSFLYLIQNGLGNSERPDWGSWGGRYGRVAIETPLYSSTFDVVVGHDGKTYHNNQATVWRWRETFQDDFASRMQWTLTSNFSQAGHPPVLNVNGKTGPEIMFIETKYNQTFEFDASATYDPDHPESNEHLDFQWYQYADPSLDLPEGFVVPLEITSLAPPAGSNATLVNNNEGFKAVSVGQKISVVVPEFPELTEEEEIKVTERFADLHLILQVRSKEAKYPSTRYQRIVFQLS